MKVYFYIIFLLFSSCAQVISPSGGKKDIDKPILINTSLSQKENELILSFSFDEYIQLNNWEDNFYVSPPLKKGFKKNIKGKTLFLSIEDTINKNLTYNISLNNCIKDINEGNVLDSLTYNLNLEKNKDTTSLSGRLVDAYSFNPVEKSWIMLFKNTIDDSLIFKTTPNYVSKTNSDGHYNFPNLKFGEEYKLVATTNLDFIYNQDDNIAFHYKSVIAGQDSFINMFSFNQSESNIDSINDNLSIENDSIISDSMNNNVDDLGNLYIVSEYSKSCIFELSKEDESPLKYTFASAPYVLKNIPSGEYSLKCIIDKNNDQKWNTGSWEKKKQPEPVKIYSSKIIIRKNWDLEIDFQITEL